LAQTTQDWTPNKGIQFGRGQRGGQFLLAGDQNLGDKYIEFPS
jgi:hypothetical protein